MKKGVNKNLRGFTIIEVALVLAIAGLIFMMVFVALPGLRASQRDAERRDNVAMFLEGVKKYQNNNRGALPPSVSVWRGDFKTKYFSGKVDPSGSEYNIVPIDCNATAAGKDCTNNELKNIRTASFPNGYQLIVVKAATCEGDKAVMTKNPRKIAVLNKLEGAGVFCGNT